MTNLEQAARNIRRFSAVMRRVVPPAVNTASEAIQRLAERANKMPMPTIEMKQKPRRR